MRGWMVTLALTSVLHAQSPAPTGSYGFLLTVSSNDTSPAESNGTAVLGLMNLDPAGNVTGSYTFQAGGSGGGSPQTATGSLTGSYSGNADGTGTLNVNLDFGADVTFATVTSDNGRVLQLISTQGSGDANNLAGGYIPLQGSGQSLTGTLPLALFVDGATGDLNLSLSGVTTAGGALTVYTSTGGTATGPITCDDGSTQTWNATVSALTVAIFPSSPGAYLGDYVLALDYTECGNGDESQTLSGSVTGNINGAGNLNLLLHGSGGVITGTARAGQTASLNGSYAFTSTATPTPAGTVGVLQFDGAGNVTLSGTAVGSPGASLQLPVTNRSFTGTYSANADGAGTMNLAATSGSGTMTYAFVTTDSGSEILLLRTDGGPVGDVVFGTARLQ